MADQPLTLTIEEARAFVERAPWRAVQHEKPGSQMDPHEYLISGSTIEVSTYWALVRLIKAEGHLGEYTAAYRPDKPMRNFYLYIGEHVYFGIPPRQLCRTRRPGQHRRLPEQESLLGEEER